MSILLPTAQCLNGALMFAMVARRCNRAEARYAMCRKEFRSAAMDPMWSSVDAHDVC